MLTGSAFAWVKARDGALPQSALEAGHERDGAPLYVARARVGAERLWSLGKLNPRDHEFCHVPWGGKEHVVREYEVLVCTPALHQDREVDDLAEAIRRSLLVCSTADSVTPPAPSLAPDCPVCLEAMAPPRRIHQCRNGHLVCGNCR